MAARWYRAGRSVVTGGGLIHMQGLRTGQVGDRWCRWVTSGAGQVTGSPQVVQGRWIATGGAGAWIACFCSGWSIKVVIPPRSLACVVGVVTVVRLL